MFQASHPLKQTIQKLQKSHYGNNSELKVTGLDVNTDAKVKLLDQYLRETAAVEAEAVQQNEILYADNQRLRKEVDELNENHLLDLEEMELKVQSMELYAKELKTEVSRLTELRNKEKTEYDQQVNQLTAELKDLKSQVLEKDIVQWIKEACVKQKKEYEAEIARLKK